MAGAFAAVLAVGCAKHEAAQSQSIAWNTSYDAALADAGRTGRPILLDFYTDW
jgi:thiol:disulfide interchange protein